MAAVSPPSQPSPFEGEGVRLQGGLTLSDLHSLLAGATRIAFDEGFLAEAVPLPSALLLALSSFSVLFGGVLRRRRAA